MSFREEFPGLAVGWAVMFSALAAHAAPPPELDVPQWSDEFRQIAAEPGARITGQWSTSTAPYLRRPMRVAGVDHPCGSVWVRAGAKVGKTQISINAIMHCIDTAPRSIMVVCPKSDKVRDFDNKAWQPAVDATSRIALKIMAGKTRSKQSSTTRMKRFRGGFMTLANACVESELQSDDIGLLVFEEPSSYPADAGGRGPPIRQARARQDAWDDEAKEIGVGTPKFVGDCVISHEVEMRTQEKYYLPCPHCGALQLLIWENMTRVEGRPHFICQGEGCGALIGHEHKRWMLEQADLAERLGDRPGGWLACFEKRLEDGSVDPDSDNPAPPPVIQPEDWAYWLERRGPERGRMLEGRDPSFDAIWQAYSPFTNWGKIWEKFDEASTSRDPDDLVTFWQQVLARPFESAYERPDNANLYENRETAARIAQVERGRVPPWAWSLFGAADIQGDRIEWAAYAVGPGGPGADGAKSRRYARIDSGIIPIPPVDPRAWSELSLIERRTYEGEHCKPLGFDRFGVDTGGHHTNRAYLWCSGRPGVMALKGASGAKAVENLPIEAGTRRKARVNGRLVASVQLYLVGTHKVKKDVYFGLTQTLAGVELGEHLPGSITLEPTATEQDFEQLTAEVLLPADPAKKRKVEVWDLAKGRRNEQLDLAVYCHAMAWSFLPDQMTERDWAGLIAQRRAVADPKALPLETIWSPTGAQPPAVKPAQPAAAPAPAHPMREALLALARATKGSPP